MDTKIHGSFKVEWGGERSYRVSFKPDNEQIWSFKPEGFTVVIGEAQVAELVGEHREPDLVYARERGSVLFHGAMTREVYWKYAGF